MSSKQVWIFNKDLKIISWCLISYSPTGHRVVCSQHLTLKIKMYFCHPTLHLTRALDLEKLLEKSKRLVSKRNFTKILFIEENELMVKLYRWVNCQLGCIWVVLNDAGDEVTTDRGQATSDQCGTGNQLPRVWDMTEPEPLQCADVQLNAVTL